jgi:hypothetical protein
MRRALPFLGRAAWPAVLACAVLAPLAVHWFSGRTLIWSDGQRLFAPQRWLVDEALRAFRLPLWNPYLGAGMPFLADAIHGVLHPVSIAVAWLGIGERPDVLVAVHVACAGLGAALLARDLGASRAGAASAAFAYGMSGFVLSMAAYPNLLAGAGSLPFCVAGLRRVAAEPRAGNLLFGAGATAILAFSGDPEALMVAGAAALALAWEAGGWRGAARAAAVGGLGLMVAAVQLVPSAVHVARTNRGDESWAADGRVWALIPWRLPELVLPGLFRSSEPFFDPLFWKLGGPGRVLRGNLPYPFAVSVTVGLLPIALAAAGARVGTRGRVLAGLALLFLWISLGPTLGADAVMRHVPIWRSFRYSEKLVGPLSLAVALLAGLGLDAIAERKVAGRWLLTAAVAAGIASIGAWGAGTRALPPELLGMGVDRLARGALQVVAMVVALGGWLLLRDRLSPALGGGALATLVWCGMAAAGPSALRPGDPASRLRSPGPVLVAPPPGPRIVTPYWHDPVATEPGLDWLDQAGRDHAARGLAAYNVRDRIESLDDLSGMRSARLESLDRAFGGQWARLARRYAGTHVVVDPPVSDEQRQFHAIATEGGTLLNPPGLPYEVWSVPHRDWAAFPPAVIVLREERSARSALVRAEAARNPAAVIEAWGDCSVAAGRVLSVERGLESVRIEAEADGDSTLVINDAWWPGWTATVDGLGVTIFRADALVRAVRWPAGRHVLEMRYRPPEARWGLLVSALGVALVAAGAFSLRRRRLVHGR